MVYVEARIVKMAVNRFLDRWFVYLLPVALAFMVGGMIGAVLLFASTLLLGLQVGRALLQPQLGAGTS